MLKALLSEAEGLFNLRLGKVTMPGERRERLVALFARWPDLEPVFAGLVASIEALEAQIARSLRLLERRAVASGGFDQPALC